MKEKILTVQSGASHPKKIFDYARIQQLKQDILKYDKQYYEEGQSDISDAEYDRLYQEYLDYEKEYPELKKMEDAPTKRVGAGNYAGTTTLLPKFNHKSPLLSINKKGKALDELKAFYDSIGGDGTEVIIEPKPDGITCNINYENGVLANAATRGNGYVGDLITENFKNTDTSYPNSIGSSSSCLEIRGEAIIPYDFFKQHLAKSPSNPNGYSNPRNAASGLMRSLNPADVKSKGLVVLFYDVGHTNISYAKKFQQDSQQILMLKSLNFSSIPIIRVNKWEELEKVVSTKMNGLIKEVDGFNVLMKDEYPQAVCDGLVIKVNDLNKRQELGMTEKGPRWAFAYKFRPLQALTHMNNIEWQVGKSGKVTPVAVFDEISLGGVKITRATLNNEAYINSLPVLNVERSVWINEPYDTWGELAVIPLNKPLERIEYIQAGDVLIDDKPEKSVGELHRITVKRVGEDGFYISHPIYEDEWYPFERNRYYLVNADNGLHYRDAIIVERSNDVIPRIVAIHHHETQKENLFTTPTKCPVCGHNLVYDGNQLFCQNINCKAQLLGHLVQFVSRDAMNIVGLGDSILEEFISHGFIKSYTDIYNLEKFQEDIIQLPKFGKRKYNNIIKSINLSKNPELSSFIYALGIPMVGKKTAKDIANAFKSVKKLQIANIDELIAVDGISEVTASHIYKYFHSQDNLEMLDGLLTYINPKTPAQSTTAKTLEGKTIVITGMLQHPRSYYVNLIEDRGGKVSGSVSKKTFAVFIGDDAGSKEAKARELKANGADILLLDSEEDIEGFLNSL